MEPYFADESVTLYHGDCREVVPALGLSVDLIVADPPYEETSIGWDRWPDGWLQAVAPTASSLWCFGSLRLFAEKWPEFATAAWTYSQDVVWEKHNGSGFAADRFKRVHEHATFWYRGAWQGGYHEPPRIAGERRPTATIRGRKQPTHTGAIGSAGYEYGDDRQARSVIYARSMHGRGTINPTEKPVGILLPLIEYACPPGGVVLDPMAGSCSTGVAARLTGRRAVLIEGREEQCEKAVRERLAQGVLDLA